MRWDIHDEMVDQFGNTRRSRRRAPAAATASAPPTKNVANVAADPPSTNNPLTIQRRRVVHARRRHDEPGPSPTPSAQHVPDRSGPFDPNYAGETLLPDGQLNAGDAPMPAARIDFSIAANTDPLHSIDGVGYFGERVEGARLQPRLHRLQQARPATCSRPFYSQYIPATSRDDLGYASGVDGALITDNFPGFLT